MSQNKLLAKLKPLYKTLAILAVFIAGLGIGIVYGPNIKMRLVAKQPVSRQLPADLNYEEVEQVYDSLRSNFDGELDASKLMDGLKDGLAAASGDPYTDYLNEEETKGFDDELNGSFSGIGAELMEREKVITVEVPLAGYPAEKAGLKAKDAIIEIDGENAYDIGIAEAVKRIRGEPGTKVKLKVVRNNREQLEFEITRMRITIPSVESEILSGGIGYLKINRRFGTDTPKLAREAAVRFTRAKVKGVILDMRNNPGGLLDAAVEVSSLWVEDGETVLEEKRAGKTIRTFTSKGSAILSNIPTVVLINEGSASASEITAGALKDHKKATLIGVKTYGKGSVQQLIDFGNGTKLKVTIARWFTPSGKNIDKEGIEPDRKVERTEEDFKKERDPQKDAAIKFLQ